MNLYISDLDGTLLNNKAVLSNTTINLLNRAISQNKKFTIATARTPATVCEIMKDVNINIPAILMNGSVIYDLKRKKYIASNKINANTVNKILKIVNNHNMNPFIYTLNNNFLNVYHSKPITPYQKFFYDERASKTEYKKFIYSPLPKDSSVLYFAILDSKEKINNMYNSIKNFNDINFTKYQDIYNKDIFYLEIYNSNSSKANGINYLKETYTFDKIICFGDNYNDIPMFEASDECYAVSNAVDDLKQISSKIIDSNINDSVAKTILKL